MWQLQAGLKPCCCSQLPVTFWKNISRPPGTKPHQPHLTNLTVKIIRISFYTILGVMIVGLLAAAETSETKNQNERVARGKYLATFGGCNDCHTSLKMTNPVLAAVGPNGEKTFE